MRGLRRSRSSRLYTVDGPDNRPLSPVRTGITRSREVEGGSRRSGGGGKPNNSGPAGRTIHKPSRPGLDSEGRPSGRPRKGSVGGCGSAEAAPAVKDRPDVVHLAAEVRIALNQVADLLATVHDRRVVPAAEVLADLPERAVGLLPH